MAAPPAPDPPAAARSLHEVVRTEDWVLSAEALMELSLFVFVLVLAYANGTNDVSKAIATLVGSGVANYRSTVLWGAIWTTVGAAASGVVAGAMRSEEHTSELQSLAYLVCRLLLEKKKIRQGSIGSQDASDDAI